MLDFFKRKQRAPQELAEQAKRILGGNCLRWDVDSYENAHLEDPTLGDLHGRTLSFGLPETWYKLDAAEKSKLQAIIDEMAQLRLDKPQAP